MPAPSTDDLQTRIAVLEERVKNRDTALKLQAEEYERRLQDLNHSHAQARAKEVEFLPRETYYKSEGELLHWRREVDEVLSGLKARRDTYVSIISVLLSIVSLGLWIITVYRGV